MHRAVDNCTQYPDPFCRTARQAIGAREGVNPDFLYCGNGAADVLDRLAAVLKPRKVLLTAPTFAEYERTLSGAEIRVHNLRETDGFALTERILDEISPDLDAVYLCNPNNPTGRTAQPELLREIVRKCTENGVKLVVDECFNDFLTDAERHTRKDLLESNPPNAGQTESVCAGALHIQLGGDASYFGKIVKKAAFGDPMRRVDRTDILAAVDLMTAASVFALVLCCVIRLIVKS
ncbi:aminotransferase class I/II-fold pyridoxal phosphate-dependent enzyme [Agathobaculum butyriciproducens]|uniref:aminotransferase class I/II-fold pyridoxal phosphate-dependent enzyme n=1 Tax=Agathobaculum butyriciproducens TaxID=1628085 RepID=UPI0036D361FE